MNLDPAAIRQSIKDKVVELADLLGSDATDLQFDEIIPATGYIDSAALLELIAWFEKTYGIRIPDNELTIDNLGSVDMMAGYLLRRRGAA
jgi:acyl carrier protein